MNKNIDKKLESLKNYLAKGNIEIVISELGIYIQERKNIFKEEIIKKLEKKYLNISARYNHLKEQNNAGIVERNNFQETVSSLIMAILELIYEIGDDLSKSENAPIPDKIIDGFFRIRSEDAMRLAISEIKNARHMKVIGMGRQDVAEATSSNHVLDYYKAVENRFLDSNNPFSIKRVTQHRLKPKFKSHLKKCFEIVEEKNEDACKYDLLLYGDLKITYTYYIINSINGNASLFLTLNTENFDLDTIDNSLVFYTKNSDIINKFNDHFDQFWTVESKLGRKISTLVNFDRYVPFDGPLYAQYTEVKHLIKRIPDDSVRMKHLKTEMEIFHRRLKGLDDCILTFNHTNRNQRLTDFFLDYIKDLRDGTKSYRTLSVAKFWEAMYHIPTLIEKQAIALAEGAIMERILLLNSEKLEEYENNKALQIAIPRNYLHHKKYENYCFSILFTSDPEELKIRDNYAIWHDEEINYKVLIDMQYGQDSKSTTTLKFANYSIREKTDMRKNQDIINQKESEFSLMKERVIDQNNSFIKYLNLSKDSAQNFASEAKDIHRKIEFMKNSGIDEIELFLQRCKVIR